MKKRILFITHLYYPSVGGAERVFQRMAEGLASLGHSVTMLTSDAMSTEQYFKAAANALSQNEVLNGVHIHRDLLSSKIYKIFRFPDRLFIRMGRLAAPFRSLFFGPHFWEEFRTILRHKFDVVIAGPTPTSTIFYGLLYKKKNPESRFIIFPCMHIEDRLHTSRLNLWAIKKADAVMALTDAEKEYLQARGVKEEKIKRVVSGVDELLLQAERAEAQELKDYILYLGQEGEHKRIPMLIEAMKNLWRSGYENRLVIAGARANFSCELDRLIDSLPQSARSKIFRFNNISEEQKVRLLDNCLMMVNPSAYESFGIVFLEAWARGKPVIGANIQALKEIIRDGQNGFLFDDRKDGDLGKKILNLLDDKELALKMGQTGQLETKEKFVWEKVVKKIESFF
jgi:glycosyltransferase involved in cell wall biosynthesis